jgi:ABC-type dipeptide/oligopeptide/nickel transport system permease subunit
MSEPTAPAAPAGRDYWDIVLAEMRKRVSVRVSAVLLVLLYAAAIYAPFLAGDRPLFLQGTDAAGYRRAQSTLRFAAADLRGLVAGGPAAQAGKPGAPPFEQALAQQSEAVTTRVATLRRQVDGEAAALLDQLQDALERSVSEARAGRTEAAVAAADEVVALGQRVKAELSPAEPGQPAEPGKTVTLQPFTRFPALEAVGRGELYVMLVWALVLLFPLWNRAVDRWLLHGERERIRRARRWKAAAIVLLPLLPLPLWGLGTELATQTSPWKAGLAKGDVQASTIIMPPVSFGLAEINDGEYLRPPTWSATAEINEAGFYVHPSRAIKTSGGDTHVQPALPVEVRHGEPARNAALRHPLGTDSLGRDVLARMIWGGRVSLSVGLISTVFLVFIGIVIGALAGYFGGWTDLLLSRLIEIFQCFPVFFLILIVVVFLGPDIVNVMVVLGVTRWTGVARLVRGEFLRLREQDFVVASEALGARKRRTIFRHILPNALGPVLVTATFSVATGILTESALSFLGFGVQQPVPSWGSLLIESRSPEHWWIQIFPGLIIFLTVVLYNLLGEGVRDALDPRLKTA